MDVARREPQRPLRCPLDRGAVRYVVPDFALRSLSDEFDDEAGRAAAENERREADDALEAYNERFRGGWCGPCSLAQRLLYFGTSLTWRLFRTLPAAVQVRIALGVLSAALYTLSPIDLLPEAALGPLGLIDDFLAWFIALGLAGEHFRGALQLARRREQ
jgi:RING finger protein 170